MQIDQAPRPEGRSAAPDRHRLFARLPAATLLADAFPDLAAAEQSAEGAALHPHGIRAFHHDRRVVGTAAVRIVNPAGPFLVRWLHVEENLLAAAYGISAEILAARLDANIALV